MTFQTIAIWVFVGVILLFASKQKLTSKLKLATFPTQDPLKTTGFR